MIWKGLLNYGYDDVAQELIYRWLYMITKNAVDYNGTIPEKYDVVDATHKVFAEYGNVGTDFEYITQEGFGWMNASYQYGLYLLKDNYIEDLNRLKSPNELFN
jgi:alpha,alpha-trehalase